MENYEKKYKNALEWARQVINGETGFIRKEVEEIFPELAESEDEKIRKELIEHIKANKWADYVLFQKFSPDDVIAWLEKQKSVEEIVERCKNSWYNEGKIAGMAEGLSDDEKYQQGWHDALKKQGEKPQGKTAIEAIKEVKVDNANKVEPKFKVGDWVVDKSGFVQQVLIFKEGIYTCTYNSFTTDCASNYHLWTIQDAKDGDVLASNYNKPFIYNGNHNSIFVGAYCGVTTINEFVKASHECQWTENFDIYPATKEQCDKLFKAMADTGYTFDFDKKELKKIEQKPAWKPSGEQMNALEHFVRSIGESGFVSPYDANLKLVYSLLNDLKKLREE